LSTRTFSVSSTVTLQADAANKLTQETTTRTYQGSSSSSSTVVQPISCDGSVGSLDTIGSGSTEQGYQYDGSNRLSAYTVGTAVPYVSSSGFLYDGLGRLSQVFDAVPGTGSTVSSPVANHSYIWCGNRICLEIDNMQPIATPDALYVAQGTVNNPTTATAVPTSQLAYDITDLLGSERAVVTNNAIVASYSYDTFGNRTTTLGSSTASNRGFTGFYYHAPSGLQFARNRVYNASLGRWMTRDPIGNGHAFDDPARFSATEFNLYAYAGNNPQSMVDPSGNFPLPPTPAGLPPGWVRDCTNLAPNSEKYVFGNGDWLRFDRGQPGKPGWRGKDHWHHSSDPERHLKSGTDVPDPPMMCIDTPLVSEPEVTNDMFNDEDNVDVFDGSLGALVLPWFPDPVPMPTFSFGFGFAY
jgi:RHS repeat-associated protein